MTNEELRDLQILPDTIPDKSSLDLPGIGTEFLINGNLYKVVFFYHNPVFTIKAELVKKHE